MTETANELNQSSFKTGWWYVDLPIQSSDVCLEFLKTEDGESLIRTLHQRARVLPCEVEEVSLVSKHPLLLHDDIEYVFRLKCKFGGRIVAQQIYREGYFKLEDFDIKSFPNYFDDEETNDNAE